MLLSCTKIRNTTFNLVKSFLNKDFLSCFVGGINFKATVKQLPQSTYGDAKVLSQPTYVDAKYSNVQACQTYLYIGRIGKILA